MVPGVAVRQCQQVVSATSSLDDVRRTSYRKGPQSQQHQYLRRKTCSSWQTAVAFKLSGPMDDCVGTRCTTGFYTRARRWGEHDVCCLFSGTEVRTLFAPANLTPTDMIMSPVCANVGIRRKSSVSGLLAALRRSLFLQTIRRGFHLKMILYVLDMSLKYDDDPDDQITYYFSTEATEREDEHKGSANRGACFLNLILSCAVPLKRQ